MDDYHSNHQIGDCPYYFVSLHYTPFKTDCCQSDRIDVVSREFAVAIQVVFTSKVPLTFDMASDGERVENVYPAVAVDIFG